MQLCLKPGESIVIEFLDTDGQITISYNDENVTVEADMPDSDGRQGIIYSERFIENMEKAEAAIAEPTLVSDPIKTDDPTIIWRKGPYYVRQSLNTNKYHVFDKEGIAEGEPLEHDHLVEFHTLKEVKKYIAEQLKKNNDYRESQADG